MKVAVVGSYGCGMTVKTPRLPAEGETILGTRFTAGPGGKGSNQAIAAARLGAETVFLTAIGDDSYGRDALALWRAEGVDASRVVTAAGATMIALIMVEPNGDNRIIVVPGALDMFFPHHVEAFSDQIAAADVVAVSMEIPLATAAAALKVGRRVGTTTLLNPAPAQPLTDDMWRDIDIVTPNRTEAAILMGFDPTAELEPAALARELAARTGGVALITLGGEGALLAEGGKLTVIPAVPADRIVDTTGAGDAFNGALAVAVAEGHSLAAAARFAAKAGAHAVTIDEVIPSLATRAELDV